MSSSGRALSPSTPGKSLPWRMLLILSLRFLWHLPSRVCWRSVARWATSATHHCHSAGHLPDVQALERSGGVAAQGRIKARGDLAAGPNGMGGDGQREEQPRCHPSPWCHPSPHQGFEQPCAHLRLHLCLSCPRPDATLSLSPSLTAGTSSAQLSSSAGGPPASPCWGAPSCAAPAPPRTAKDSSTTGSRSLPQPGSTSDPPHPALLPPSTSLPSPDQARLRRSHPACSLDAP